MGHVTSLVYLLELTPSYMRGKILVANQMVKPFGNSVSGLVNLAISKSIGSSEWRFVNLNCGFKSLIVMVHACTLYNCSVFSPDMQTVLVCLTYFCRSIVF